MFKAQVAMSLPDCKLTFAIHGATKSFHSNNLIPITALLKETSRGTQFIRTSELVASFLANNVIEIRILLL